jgi:hypothetical protein
LRLILVALAAGELSRGADNAPSWLQQAASAPLPAYARNVPAAVLLHEQSVTVDAGGRITSVRRYVVRILLAEGRQFATGGESYTSDTGKVVDMQAWLIQPSGEVKRYGKDKNLDLPASMAGDNMYGMYSNVRYRLIKLEDHASKGSIFGYESTLEDRPVFNQFVWYFQENMPSLVSRFRLTVPPGWSVTSVTHNRAPIDPLPAENSRTWEVRDLPPIETEPASPQLSSLAPRVDVSFFAPPGAAGPGRSFVGWTDVSRWLSELADPQSEPDDAISSKARELTAGAKAPYEQIQIIGRFVQGLRYVSIQLGVGRGGGYRPHAASEVFAKSYGDCNDKANLMRSMLKALGIPSYPVRFSTATAPM